MARIKTILCCALVASTAHAGLLQRVPPVPMPSGIGVYFGPDDRVEDRLIELIRAAKQEILLNQSAITSQRIAREIVSAVRTRHLIVGVILDANPDIPDNQAPEYFRLNDVAVFLRTGEGRNNNRYVVIDRQAVITGSYEFTNAAATKNHENVIIINETAVAVAYYNNWVAMAGRCTVPGKKAP